MADDMKEEMEKEETLFLAPEGFNPIEDLCELVEDEVILKKGARTKKEAEERKQRTIDKIEERFQNNKQIEIDKIKVIRESKLANFTYNGTIHYWNERAVNSLKHKIDICEVVGDFTYNGYNFSNKNNLQDLYEKMCISGERVFLEYYAVRMQINNCNTQEELDAHINNS